MTCFTVGVFIVILSGDLGVFRDWYQNRAMIESLAISQTLLWFDMQVA
jgi:hypothetical protein